MQKATDVFRKVLLGTLLATMIGGCGAQRFEHTPVDEIPPGPGLFSGPGGEFVLSSDKKPQELSAADYREFQEYQQWKATAKDSPEYREFMEWREWKAYRKWRERESK